MSLGTVQTAIVNQFQKNTALDSYFADTLTGAVTSAGVNITGVGTAFTTEVEVGDYIGNPTVGYRKVLTVPSDEALTVKSAFDAPLIGATIKKTQIKKGTSKNEEVSRVGRVLRIGFVTTAESDENVPNTQVCAEYGFVIVIEFMEPDSDEAEDRIGLYDKAIRDCVDANPGFSSACLATTDVGQLFYGEIPHSNGIWKAAAGLVVKSSETRGNR